MKPGDLVLPVKDKMYSWCETMEPWIVLEVVLPNPNAYYSNVKCLGPDGKIVILLETHFEVIG